MTAATTVSEASIVVFVDGDRDDASQVQQADPQGMNALLIGYAVSQPTNKTSPLNASRLNGSESFRPTSTPTMA